MFDSTPTETGVNRPPIGKLRERDIDLLLCCELHFAGVLRDRFAEIWDREDIEFIGAWVSHSESDGETDLVVMFRGGSKSLCLLVENKIGAEFQDGQPERYAARAKSWVERNDADEVLTVLLAPSDYFERPEAEIFKKHISYEALIEDLKGVTDDRSRFFSKVLKQGIDKARQGYTSNPDDAVTEIWRTIYSRSRLLTPDLNMKPEHNRKGRPRNSAFIYFRRAKGFPLIKGKKGVVIKGDRGFVDLQFSATTESELRSLVQKHIDKDMKVRKAGKSAVVRVHATPIDFKSSPSAQMGAIDENLNQAERLRKFYIRYKSLLEKILFPELG